MTLEEIIRMYETYGFAFRCNDGRITSVVKEGWI